MGKSKKTAQEATASANTAEKVQSGSLYAFEDFVKNPGVLGACADIVSAALTEKGIKEATIEDAKAIVKEFKERKVQ